MENLMMHVSLFSDPVRFSLRLDAVAWICYSITDKCLTGYMQAHVLQGHCKVYNLCLHMFVFSVKRFPDVEQFRMSIVYATYMLVCIGQVHYLQVTT